MDAHAVMVLSTREEEEEESMAQRETSEEDVDGGNREVNNAGNGNAGNGDASDSGADQNDDDDNANEAEQPTTTDSERAPTTDSEMQTPTFTRIPTSPVSPRAMGSAPTMPAQHSMSAVMHQPGAGMHMHMPHMHTGPYTMDPYMMDPSMGEYAHASDGSAHSNLYVKNIPENIDDSTLHRLFAPYGTVISSFVMVDAATRQSRGFGFVKFANVDMAMKAIQAMNGQQFGDRQLVVKFANSDAVPRSDPMSGGTPSDNIFVKCLPQEYSEENLRALFGQYGMVSDCKILLAADNSSRCQGLVRFSAVEEAHRAIQFTNGRVPVGGTTPLIVRFADTPSEKARKHRVAMDTRGMAYGYQKPYNQLSTSLEGMQMSSGMGPIHGDPTQVWSNMQHRMGGNGGMAPVTSIVIKGLPDTADDLLLYRMFAQHGAITSVKTLRDEAGKCKGIAFVNFCHAQEAARAVASNDGKHIGDRHVLKVFLQGERPGDRNLRGMPMHGTGEAFVIG